MYDTSTEWVVVEAVGELVRTLLLWIYESDQFIRLDGKIMDFFHLGGLYIRNHYFKRKNNDLSSQLCMTGIRHGFGVYKYNALFRLLSFIGMA